MKSILEKLDRLSEFHAQQDKLDGDKQGLINKVLTPEIKARLADIESEFEKKAEAVSANIAALEAEIKAESLAHGETVKGKSYQAVWNNGRLSWDNKGLSFYAESHPEVMQFRKQGDPSVTIRRIGSKGDTKGE